MIKTFKLDDEQFYNQLTPEGLEYFSGIKDAAKTKNVVPLTQITGGGYQNSWYNYHIGKTYEIYRYIVDTDYGHVNFLVKSRNDGTSKGYKPMYSRQGYGKGIDIVHAAACKLTIGFLEKPKNENKQH